MTEVYKSRMTIDQAAKLMTANLADKSTEERQYIMDHFIDHLREAGYSPTETFITAFLLACAPFKEGAHS